ncbi:MAG: hypothetical protein WCT39_03925, partial [Candidatus Margulisiibacteriota bacterium]
MENIKYDNSAKHTAGASKNLKQLAWKFFITGKWHYFILMLSDHGRSIMTRKYDAFSTDRAYRPHFSGLLWPLGAFIDRFIWNFPMHQALRERVNNVSDILCELTASRIKINDHVKILSAPCGLVMDLIYTTEKLLSRQLP